ncbi:MAG: SDR family oxidoreductase [Candidatus Binatia bacterium]
MTASRIFREGLLGDQVAIVTGGGTGIGKAIALELGRSGADLAIASRKLENVEPAAREIERETGRRCVFATCDIREPEQVEAFVGKVEADYGRIDILVNNAGGQFSALAETISVKGWNTVINNNLNGLWYVTQAVAKRMIPRKRGRIISITADTQGGMPGIVHSSAARAAVANMTQTLALEWARHGILLNAVAPGPVRTPGFDRAYDDETQTRSLAEAPLGRLPSPEDVAWLVTYLASPAAAFVTGQEWVLNGGHTGATWTIAKPQ